MIGCILALLMAPLADDEAAGATYRRGVKLLEEKKYAEAGAAFEEALRHAPSESPSLKYRDDEGRQEHPYFPYYGLARATLGQAEAESSPFARRDRLRQAARYLELTAHPWRERRLAEAKSALAEVERTIAERERALTEREASAIPAEVTALQGKVQSLCDAEQFEAALRELEGAAEVLKTRPRVREDLDAIVRVRQRFSLNRYEEALTSRLEGVCRTDPTLEAEYTLTALRPARVPAEVAKDPGPRAAWLTGFYSLYEKQLDAIRGSRHLSPERLKASADVFEASASAALDVKLPLGFRAARNVAHFMRLARLKELAATGDPGLPGYASLALALARAAEESSALAERLARRRMAEWTGSPEAEELKRYVEGDLPYQKTQVDTARLRSEERVLAHERLLAAEALLKKAQDGLVTRGIMAEPAECRKIDRALTELERQPEFESLPAPLRARVLLTRALCNAVISFLEADKGVRAHERCRTDVVRARVLDPKADAPWRQGNSLSPKILSVFDKILER